MKYSFDYLINLNNKLKVKYSESLIQVENSDDHNNNNVSPETQNTLNKSNLTNNIYQRAGSIHPEYALPQNRIVKITEFPKWWNEDDLKQIMIKFGNILQIHISRNLFTQPLTCFVKFLNPLAARNATNELNNSIYEGCKLRASIVDIIQQPFFTIPQSRNVFPTERKTNLAFVRMGTGPRQPARKVCSFFLKGMCAKRLNCTFLHYLPEDICKFYIKGQCIWSSCRLVHMDPENRVLAPPSGQLRTERRWNPYTQVPEGVPPPSMSAALNFVNRFGYSVNRYPPSNANSEYGQEDINELNEIFIQETFNNTKSKTISEDGNDKIDKMSIDIKLNSSDSNQFSCNSENKIEGQ